MGHKWGWSSKIFKVYGITLKLGFHFQRFQLFINGITGTWIRWCKGAIERDSVALKEALGFNLPAGQLDTTSTFSEPRLRQSLDKALCSDCQAASLIYCRWVDGSGKIKRFDLFEHGVYTGRRYSTKMDISFGRTMRNHLWGGVPHFQRKSCLQPSDRRQGGGYTLASRGLTVIGWMYQFTLEYIW